MRLIKPKFNLAFVTADIINPPAKLSPMELEDEEETGESYIE